MWTQDRAEGFRVQLTTPTRTRKGMGLQLFALKPTFGLVGCLIGNAAFSVASLSSQYVHFYAVMWTLIALLTLHWVQELCICLGHCHRGILGVAREVIVQLHQAHLLQYTQTHNRKIRVK